MSFNEWKKLIRESKNNNDYHQLRTCVKGYIAQKHDAQTVYQFYALYSKKDIKDWYKDINCYEYFYKRVYGKSINIR